MKTILRQIESYQETISGFLLTLMEFEFLEIIKKLQNHSRLKVFQLQSCHVNDVYAKEIALVTLKIQNLQELTLTNNDISDVGAETIFQVLLEADRCSVTKLNLE